MALRDITREQVLAAVGEYDALGQEAFLAKYGFDRSRAYLLIHEGKTYDSKAVVGAAHGLGSGNQALSAGEFSGGEATVGHLLRRLGFTVEVSADPDAAELIKQITSLTVDRSSGRPALYQPITLLWAIGRAYRGGPRMESWDITHRQVGELLERHGRGARPRPDYPIAALRRAGLWELDADGDETPNAHGDTELRRWFDTHQPRSGLVSWAYDLMQSSHRARVPAVGAILDTFFSDADPALLLEDVGLSETGISALMGEDLPQDSPAEEAYRKFCGIADRYQERGAGGRAARALNVLLRSAAARRAVLIRSGGRCENPGCTGQAEDLTDSGDAILEVDHIKELAQGGADNPAQMIALCPNCHAIKTRGRTREQLREVLLITARRRHDALL